ARHAARRDEGAPRPRHARSAGTRPRRPARARERQAAPKADGGAAPPARRVRAGERRRDVREARRLLRPPEEPLPLIRAAVTVPVERAEELRARFVELAPAGFEERDIPGAVELAAFGEAAERVAAEFPDARLVEIEPGWEDR